uniref:Putative defensin n=1 Tax=Phlebotomus kandelakii TaxID=1109342 RepID=A0A6B2EAI8_9DIPT
MRTLLITFALVAVVGVVSAYPSSFVGDFEDLDDRVPDEVVFQEALFEQPEIHSRQKRATCDLLSAFGIGHAACAAHCIGHGYRGGWCDSRAVCNCRK